MSKIFKISDILRLINICALLAVFGLSSGCDFANSASELTFGSGKIPELSQEMNYPSMDELTDLSGEGGAEGSEPFPNFPTSLSESTMAHLVGALGVQGECAQVVDLAKNSLNQQVQRAYFTLTACTDDDRCTDSCPVDFYGLSARTQLRMTILKGEETKDLTKLLSEDSASAIVQIRLQIKDLSFFQGIDDERESTNQHIEDFELWLGAPDIEPLRLLDSNELNRIANTVGDGEEGAFERYEIPRNSLLAQTLISNILGGRDVVLDLEQRFKIPRDDLYLMNISPAGISQVIQPEIVINAIKAATSRL